MIVVALLSRESSQRLVAAARGRALVTSAQDDFDLLRLAGQGVFAAVVFDPSLVGAERLEAIGAVAKRYSLPVIVYASLAPAVVHAIIRLSGCLQPHAVLYGDNDASQLRTALAAVQHGRVTAAVVRSLTPALQQMPTSLRANVTAMFSDNIVLPSPDELARASGMTRRSLDRWMLRSGVSSVRLLITAARLCRGARILLNPEVPLSRAATALGCGSTRLLDRHCRALLSMTAAEVRTRLREEEVLGRAATRVLRTCDGGVEAGADPP